MATGCGSAAGQFAFRFGSADARAGDSLRVEIAMRRRVFGFLHFFETDVKTERGDQEAHSDKSGGAFAEVFHGRDPLNSPLAQRDKTGGIAPG